LHTAPAAVAACNPILYNLWVLRGTRVEYFGGGAVYGLLWLFSFAYIIHLRYSKF
jgi:hypothetical protein